MFQRWIVCVKRRWEIKDCIRKWGSYEIKYENLNTAGEGEINPFLDEVGVEVAADSCGNGKRLQLRGTVAAEGSVHEGVIDHAKRTVWEGIEVDCGGEFPEMAPSAGQDACLNC